MTDTPAGPGGRPRRFTDPDEFARLTDEYFAQTKTPNLAGLCVFLGFVDKESFTTYAEYGDEFSRTVKAAKIRMEADRHAKLMERDTFTPGLIFDLKNNHGWRDKTDLEMTGADGGPIRTETKLDTSALTTDQLRALASISVK